MTAYNEIAKKCFIRLAPLNIPDFFLEDAGFNLPAQEKVDIHTRNGALFADQQIINLFCRMQHA